MKSEIFSRDYVTQIHNSLIAAINDREVTAFAELFDPNAVMMPSSGEVIEGRSAIASTFNDWLNQGICDWQGSVDELLVFDEIAIERSTVTAGFRDEAGNVTYGSTNNLIVHRRQSDGSWLMARDIWTAKPQ